MNLEAIQSALRDADLDGWLFFDHHRRDPLAYRVLGFEPLREPTRRWYYLIRAEGEPEGLVHAVESSMLAGLPGTHRPYSGWLDQKAGLQRLLRGCRRVAMQYSPECAISYVALVDAGTVELVRSLGVEVASSADLVAWFEARWSESQVEQHLRAGRLVDEIRRGAFQEVGRRLQAGQAIYEHDIVAWITKAFERSGLVTSHGPIVAAGSNSRDPHYEPPPDGSRRIAHGEPLLIDLWAKLNEPNAVFYDITWNGFCGTTPPDDLVRVFEAVKTARDRAVQTVSDAVAQERPLRGWEVDDAARGSLRAAGLERHFVHRTGHSIGVDIHGNGANMDNFETHDVRLIVPTSCFSVEPGVYLPEFGVRSEVNVLVAPNGARTTGEVQESLVLI